ncbi:nucleotide exchange factor GrpE [Amycolatopsis acidiphila]|uniref:Protein GrpE n=1 Tax=Amycolatopsis acidiphila TaxID=715473 RepID=A0A558AGS6_9PSEU|nr:nucleotide exchange factor GrpE [Amycolatopsis acidiphila]TVT23462.1 nucleotide exchange factor GrpE [Amycolatopsis acidiphila]UIJ59918.1 nucleotide exchange factor GrpE [Amycolatopsis acidiphila]GHG62440.1 protein GrpE [Amycolatopsis acidiphila]
MTGKHSYEAKEQEREAAEPVVVRDRRKIDPETGQVREQPAPAAEEAPEGPPGPSLGESIVDDSVGVQSDVEKQLAERTADLQRLQAEYANYRKRVDRDREAVVVGAKASVVNDLLPLLDDLERAEQHGDLTGAFKAVADKLVASLQRSGLESFGAEGEPFDPSVHEAVQHSTSPEVAGPTVTTVLRRGYRFGDRTLRAALVGVTDHEPGGAPPAVDAPIEGELPVEQLSDENQQ